MGAHRTLARRVARAQGERWVSQWARIDARLKKGWRLVRYTDHQGTRLAKWMPPPGARPEGVA